MLKHNNPQPTLPLNYLQIRHRSLSKLCSTYYSFHRELLRFILRYYHYFLLRRPGKVGLPGKFRRDSALCTQKGGLCKSSAGALRRLVRFIFCGF